MKKHLVLGSVLFAAISAFPQAGNKARPSAGITNATERIAKKFAALNVSIETPSTGNSSDQTIAPVIEPADEMYNRTSSVSTFTSSWNSFTGSMNINGNLVNTTRPLQYNDELGVISFIHRKSATYVMSPQPAVVGAQSGGVVAMISQNCGATWDSTLVWNNASQWARYPQGAIYNTPGNTNINNAFITAMGPVTPNSGGWTGNFFASKPLGAGTYTNIAGSGNAQQYLPSTAPYGSLDKTDFARQDMSATDDGQLHGLGLICETPNPTVTNYRGARVVKSAFTSGTFVWTGDSIIPDVTTKSDGSKNLINGAQYMAWNEAGDVGYVFHLGVRKNQTAPENMGFQPVIMKTTNGGLSWSSISGIDFTQPSFVAPVMDHLLSTKTNTNLTIPFFNFQEGICATVDKNNDLHIVSMLYATASSHPDSLGYVFNSFVNYDGETYTYNHTQNLRPTIYDFIGGASSAPWKVVLVDELTSEGPGAAATDDGFGFNLWAADPTLGTKVVSDARIQTSRTPDGRFVVYTYAESDTTLTSTAGNGSVKWNQIPNVKARLYDVNTGTLNTNKINITRPSAPALRNTNVASRAYFHYVAPTCILSQTVPVGANGPAISLPMTVSNNGNLSGTDPVSHRFSLAALNFGSVAESDIYQNCSRTTLPDGISENQSSTVNSFIFPNPATNSAVLSINLVTGSTVNISILNMVGQVVKTSATEGQAGENIIPIDLSGLSKGIYMTTVKVNNVSSTKKLIVQ